jgi:hypothetical protein
LRSGYKYSIAGKNNFKANYFLKLDFGEHLDIELIDYPKYRIPEGFKHYYSEKKLMHPKYNCDISGFDEELFRISDDTFIDGNMQTEKYILDYKPIIQDWFSVPGALFNGCTIHFRGTEYRGLSDVLLPVDYFKNAVNYLTEKYGDIPFRVVTDDFDLATKYFPDYPILGRSKFMNSVEQFILPIKTRLNLGPNQRAIGRDFAAIQNSKYLIIPNSSFSWWGAWTNRKVVEVIAPKYWARHNISDGFWSTGDIFTRGWTWQDRDKNFELS